MNKKSVIIIIAVVVFLLMLIPIPIKYKDGGTVEYKAVLYSVKKIHRLNELFPNGYQDGLEVRILGIKVHSSIDNPAEYFVSFNATITDVKDDFIMVEPEEGTDERTSGDTFFVGLDKKYDNLEIGKKVKITYNGMIAEVYPPRISAVKVEVIE